MPPICRFWQQGNCRNGDNCRFQHPGSTPVANDNNNRYSALQGPSNSNSRSSTSFQNKYASSSSTIPYGLDKKAIISDLTTERPQWILSAYGPGRQAPAQLFGGPLREQSFEEMRLAHYMGMASGNPQQAVQEAEKLYRAAEQQIQTALNNVDGAIDFIVKADNEHPNRIDICSSSRSNGPEFQQNPTGVQPTPAVNAFGAPSQPAPAFGAPSAPSGAFGQPSVLGQKPNPFGAATPAFGAPSQIGTEGGFGQPSILGQKPSPFGAPSGTAAPFSVFSNPAIPFSQAPISSAFGAPSQPAALSPFSAPSQPVATNPFSASSPPAAGNPFAAPAIAFGQQPNPQQGNPFASQNPLSNTNSMTNLSASPFGAPSPALKNPFAAATSQGPSTFGGTPASQNNPFSRSAAAQPTPNGLGAHIQQQNPPNNANPFGKPSVVPSAPNTINPQTSVASQPSMNGMGGMATNLSEHPHPDNYIVKDASGRLLTFNNKRVVYKNNEPGISRPDGSWDKIWFPDGPPVYNKDTVGEDKYYDDATKQAYMYAIQHGRFEKGMMPLLPPKREWCRWDF